jgi:hypothetical protein
MDDCFLLNLDLSNKYNETRNKTELIILNMSLATKAFLNHKKGEKTAIVKGEFI